MTTDNKIDDVVAMAEYHGLDPVEARRNCEQFAQAAQQFNAIRNHKAPPPSSPLWEVIRQGVGK